ncbi:MAG TPA: iron-sulfur cluster assembly accessory protein [Planctomycetaceae bacterium]|nr:iron-sulfur cluster assembly accessory protein [Planctomycetaceae bacterium]HRF00980.1 iron-sulfur cluster assembly accessory protein [Pirellulaceae bacterium]
MSVMLTEKAAEEVKRAMSSFDCEPDTLLRVSVLGGGCSGFEYGLNFVKESDEGADLKTVQHGVTVVVDRKSAMLLEGTTLDFHEGLDKRGFTFENPNVVRSCGCGKSFQV